MNVGDRMDRSGVIKRFRGPRPSLTALGLLLLQLAVWPMSALLTAGERPVPAPADLLLRLEIPIYPGSELIALEGPTIEQVDLQRPGWEFTGAEVLVADFLVSDPIADLRRYYRKRCVRDPMLLLVLSDVPDHRIVAVRYAARHPLHPKKRWLRIVSYCQSPSGAAQRDGT